MPEHTPAPEPTPPTPATERTREPDPDLVEQTRVELDLFNRCGEDRHRLKRDVEQLFKAFATDAIYAVEELLKHDPDKDDRDRLRLFQAYRSRLLNKFNQCVREAEPVLRCYAVAKVLERTVQTRRLKPNFKVRGQNGDD